MNKYDPTLPDTSQNGTVGVELSVEDVVSLDDLSNMACQDVVAGDQEPEDTETTEDTISMVLPPPIVPKSIPGPIQVMKRRVSGRYRSCRRYWELTLRVDVDGKRPMRPYLKR